MPMQSISMDLHGKFYPKSNAGNCNTLTVICIITGYTICIPLKSKITTKFVQAYVDNIYLKFCGSTYIMCEKGTEFKKNLCFKM